VIRPAPIYRITHFGEPVHARPELCETQPPHADMLRYDLAFHCPDQPELVVFPIMRSSSGATMHGITARRWESFCMKVNPTRQIVDARSVETWITYQHPAGQGFGLVPCVLRDYLKEHGLKLSGWR
jgi:hypothetical protein